MSTADSVNISMEPLIEVRDLRVAFGERRRRFEAVRGVSFDIRQGETFGLVGESGSGKTSIGRAIIRVYQTGGNASPAGFPGNWTGRSPARSR